MDKIHFELMVKRMQNIVCDEEQQQWTETREWRRDIGRTYGVLKIQDEGFVKHIETSK